MPMNATQLAALVERARLKTPPVVAKEPPAPGLVQRATRPSQTAAATLPLAPAPTTQRPVQRQKAAPSVPLPQLALPQQRMVPAAKTVPASPAPAPSPPPNQTPTAQPSAADELDEFPFGWELSKESWHFHRRFYHVFRRPMRRGEYSHLLWQIRRRTAEHLWEDCWRVALPDCRGTLAVRATRWRLITILPRDWTPPATAAQLNVGAAPVQATSGKLDRGAQVTRKQNSHKLI